MKGGGGSGKAGAKAMNGAQRRLFQYPDMTTETDAAEAGSFPACFGLFQAGFFSSSSSSSSFSVTTAAPEPQCIFTAVLFATLER